MHVFIQFSFAEDPARNMKDTLSKFGRDVGPLCDDGISEVEQYLSALLTLHSQTVADALCLNYHRLNATFLDPSTLLLLSYVRVTAGSLTVTRPAALQA